MNHYQLETDLQHLEQVLARISLNDRIPLSYWRKRVDSLTSVASVPSQRSRVQKLNAALRALEERAQA
ncbi:hypothetical protein [Paraburkholderia humisilvae]|uniref:Uncharacterized protein n=1 Tax=Paraburkholderia humisilvae TaxID=627669 RepID=A0A6J5F747_9BURK|nr:hypothetical protein [Paraburkholderia humisilvae]CAB3773135.1 hypothetical protein LMG29542_07114 [Paraburkholderia humisilvae]